MRERWNRATSTKFRSEGRHGDESRGAAGCAAGGASPGGPAGGDQGPAGRLCASAGIARRQRSSDRKGDTVMKAAAPLAAPPVAHPPADPRAEIKALLADYARALESRDVNEVQIGRATR